MAQPTTALNPNILGFMVVCNCSPCNILKNSCFTCYNATGINNSSTNKWIFINGFNNCLHTIQPLQRESNISSYSYHYHYWKQLPISNQLTFIVPSLKLVLCKQMGSILLVCAWILNIVADLLILKLILIRLICLKLISLSKQSVCLVHVY